MSLPGAVMLSASLLTLFVLDSLAFVDLLGRQAPFPALRQFLVQPRHRGRLRPIGLAWTASVVVGTQLLDGWILVTRRLATEVSILLVAEFILAAAWMMVLWWSGRERS